ncbi:hypothetical protein VTN00DRAFT_6603 [Thermoascus crustaceus]|uniref:uncharacterized protein n=1 Tax=Thermoascus crustaceus TaxID=5088 RepID=UPI00374211E9
MRLTESVGCSEREFGGCVGRISVCDLSDGRRVIDTTVPTSILHKTLSSTTYSHPASSVLDCPFELATVIQSGKSTAPHQTPRMETGIWDRLGLSKRKQARLHGDYLKSRIKYCCGVDINVVD